MKEKQIATHLASILNSETPSAGAILISGNWGAGKTYFWNKSVVPLLKSKHVYTSVFGLDSIKQLKSAILTSATINNKGKLSNESAEKIASYGKVTANILKDLAIGYVAKKTEVNILESAANIIGEINPLSLISKNTIICLDDLERSVLSVEEISGVIDELNTRECKVILIANTKELSHKRELFLKYKEKVISRTFEVTADMDSAYDHFVKKYSRSSLRKFFAEYQDDILSFFRECDYHNLRSLQRVLSILDTLFGIKNLSLDTKTIHFLLALIIEDDTNGLKSDYELYTGYKHRIFFIRNRNAKEEDLKDPELASFKFNQKFFKANDPRSSKEIFQFIKNGYPDELGLVQEISPWNAHSKLAALIQKFSDGNWYFSTDSEIENLISECESHLLSETIETSQELFIILEKRYLLFKHIGEAPNDDLEMKRSITNTIGLTADTKHPIDFTTRAFQNSRPYLDQYIKDYEEALSANQANEFYKKFINAFKDDQLQRFLGDYFSNRMLLDLLSSEKIRTFVMDKKRQYPESFYEFFRVFIAHAIPYNAEPQTIETLKFTKEILINSSYDRSSKTRFDFLINLIDERLMPT